MQHCRTIAAALLLTCLSASGQAFTLEDPAFLGNAVALAVAPPTTNGFVDTYYPTNITGYPVAVWLVAENCKGSTYTNASGLITNWPDYSLNAWDFTNTVANAEPTISNNWLNTRSVAVFDGNNDILKCSRFTNYLNIEFFLVASFPWADANEHRIITDGIGSILTRRNTTSGAWYAMSQIGNTIMPTNKWWVYNAMGTPTSCYQYTNNVEDVHGGVTLPNYGSGLGVGDRYSSAGYATPMAVAEIIIYSTNLTAQLRTNVYSYLTNKYFLNP